MTRRLCKKIFILFVTTLLVLSCRNNNVELTQSESLYVLPYAKRNSFTCIRGWNTDNINNPEFEYTVAFAMPVRTEICAARAGKVVFVRENFFDNSENPGEENMIVIDHGDSTFAKYIHLTFNGALFEEGKMVKQGELIGLSGKSGTSQRPLVRFEITRGGYSKDCRTIPFLFKNTKPHQKGLEQGQSYMAEYF